jgi:hypothetical protein
MVLCKHCSRKAVIEAAKQAGRKWRELSYAELNAQALAYCEANREAMIAKALRAIQESPKLQKLAEQERRRRAKRSGPRRSDRDGNPLSHFAIDGWPSALIGIF